MLQMLTDRAKRICIVCFSIGTALHGYAFFVKYVAAQPDAFPFGRVASLLGALFLLATIFVASWGQRLPDGKNCHICNYSLRNNSSGYCPECGKKIPHWVHKHIERDPE